MKLLSRPALTIEEIEVFDDTTQTKCYIAGKHTWNDVPVTLSEGKIKTLIVDNVEFSGCIILKTDDGYKIVFDHCRIIVEEIPDNEYLGYR